MSDFVHKNKAFPIRNGL